MEGRSLEDYLANDLLRAAVERKLTVIGEAISQLRAAFPDIADSLPDVSDIVGFRNLLVHGYYKLDDRRVFDTATISVPQLLIAAERVLNASGGE